MLKLKSTCFTCAAEATCVGGAITLTPVGDLRIGKAREKSGRYDHRGKQRGDRGQGRDPSQQALKYRGKISQADDNLIAHGHPRVVSEPSLGMLRAPTDNG